MINLLLAVLVVEAEDEVEQNTRSELEAIIDPCIKVMWCLYVKDPLDIGGVLVLKVSCFNDVELALDNEQVGVVPISNVDVLDVKYTGLELVSGLTA
ncbi:hypothetical protein NDU88_008022 [Pleurodeles waltl]|uniref:Uncharacterized protein n=1 Tax=Pleurodeles waltl TaxID=8319 RepID=A0AAV7N7K8_PLEWA|nr:hypothetical protein NDU88_008022 [Pleurodeles waltl]